MLTAAIGMFLYTGLQVVIRSLLSKIVGRDDMSMILNLIILIFLHVLPQKNFLNTTSLRLRVFCCCLFGKHNAVDRITVFQPYLHRISRLFSRLFIRL